MQADMSETSGVRSPKSGVKTQTSTSDLGLRTSDLVKDFGLSKQDPLWVRITLTSLAVLILTFLIIIPVVYVFVQAFERGVSAYFQALVGDANTLHAILLTLIVAPTAVALNLVFGVAAAWA